ncbi:MAG: hypothetical protein H7316_20720 [Tardiphaga sp.]|uniref:hypothetical protein n=1 Tax=Tardiphaga sp. TaxID=1926292 RepID=UPI0019BBB079|nr:hypothetical protein [Tardiphaga sp.]MBC7586166.1 hypothetical protein [Tardiphaga sp.]
MDYAESPVLQKFELPEYLYDACLISRIMSRACHALLLSGNDYFLGATEWRRAAVDAKSPKSFGFIKGYGIPSIWHGI